MTAQVEVDTKALVAGLRKLSDGIAEGVPPTALKAAEQVAQNIRSRTPVRTGRLVGSIAVTTERDGYGVVYGAGVPYARPVAARSGAVGDGIAGVPEQFGADARTVAERTINRL